MARMRSLKPEFFLDRKLARNCSRDARLFYMGLWTAADEHARAHGDVRLLRGQLMPYDDDVTDSVVTGWLDELVGHGAVVRYEVEGDPYLHLPKLAKHQRLDERMRSRLPEPEGLPQNVEPSPSAPAQTPQQSEEPADESVGNTDESVQTADESVGSLAKHVASSRLQVAGCRLQGAGVAPLPLTPELPSAVAEPLTPGQRADRLLKPWWVKHGDQQTGTYPAAMKHLTTALTNGIGDDALREALRVLATEGRPITPNTLQFAMRPPSGPRSTTDDRVAAGLAIAQRLEAQGL